MTTGGAPVTSLTRSPLRDIIIDAVAGLARSRGWSATTMADVAGAAGVSRQTVYNEFGSRQALVEAYLTREVDTLVAAVEAAVRAHADDAHVALREAFALFLQLASDEPVVHVIVSNADSDDLQQTLTRIAQALATEHIGALIGEVWPQVGAQDAGLLADTLVRLAVSYSLVPNPARSPAQVAADVARMLTTYVDELLG